MEFADVIQTQTSCAYRTLADLKKCSPNDEIHLVAVVAEMKNIQSVDILENLQLATNLFLSDSSVNCFTQCTVYSQPTDEFSKKIKVGQIIILDKIHVQRKPGRPPSLCGKLNIDGFTVVLLKYQPVSDVVIVYHSCTNYALSESCNEKASSIAVLKDYINNVQGSLSSERMLSVSNVDNIAVCRLNQLMRYKYHNIVVQAISVFVGDMGNVILRCWDATTPPSCAFFCKNENISEVIQIDQELDKLAKEYRCDIIFYSEHGEYLKNNVMPGDVLLLVNVHYYVSPNDSMLVVHEGGKRYNRGSIILDNLSPAKTMLLKELQFFVDRKTLKQKLFDSSLEPRMTVEDEANALTTNTSISNDYAIMEQICEEAHFVTNSRQCQIKALQLDWIAIYVIEKLISLQNGSFPSALLHHLYALASKGAEFLMTNAFNRLERINKDFPRNICKLSLSSRDHLLKRYLLNCLESTYEDMFKMLNIHPKISIPCNIMNIRENCVNHNKQKASNNMSWEFIKCIIPGTSLSLSSWLVSLAFDCVDPVFALICLTCDLWFTVSVKSCGIYSLCPACFQRKENSRLYLQCYMVFNDSKFSVKHNEKMLHFLFPLSLLAFFLVDVPGSAVDAASKWRDGLENEEKRKISDSIQITLNTHVCHHFHDFMKDLQKTMLSKYFFALSQLRIRKVDSAVAIVEVENILFRDR